MKVEVEIEIEMDSESDAEAIFGALEVDDEAFIRTMRKGSTIICLVSAKNVQGARRAADDWLACLTSSLK